METRCPLRTRGSRRESKAHQRPIFDPIADMPNYGRWLPVSEAFGGTTEVSPYPVRPGTTYLDAGPAGQRPDSVTGFPKLEGSKNTTQEESRLV